MERISRMINPKPSKINARSIADTGSIYTRSPIRNRSQDEINWDREDEDSKEQFLGKKRRHDAHDALLIRRVKRKFDIQRNPNDCSLGGRHVSCYWIVMGLTLPITCLLGWIVRCRLGQDGFGLYKFNQIGVLIYYSRNTSQFTLSLATT